ncbi:MAG: hypothetical protein IPJ19_09645 [Planctomycetes bacterium]|nr:hypothetical protein [Planctomycetota bacterium]
MRALLLLAAALAQCVPALAGDRVNVRWQTKTGTSAALPPGFPESAQAALAAWEPFLKSAGYRVDVDTKGRVLLCTSEKDSHADALLRQLAKVDSWIDARFPASAGEAEDKTAPDCAALFVLRNPEDYAALLAQLAAVAPNLASWASQAGKETGFVLIDPLCAAFLESAPGMKEWSPVHELIDRAAQLFFLQRHGEQPYWLQQGVAWAAEWAYDGTLYSFPYRSEFVFATEHGAWPGELRTLAKERGEKPIDLGEFCAMRRGSWDAQRARLSFGAASFLALQPGDKLAQALHDLRAFREDNNRTYKDDGSWVSDPSYEVPAEKQLELLEARLGPKLMERVTAFLAKGNESFKGLAKP